MAGRNKGFLNLNRFKSGKAIKRQMKYGAKKGKVDSIVKRRLGESRSFGVR